MAPWGAVLEQSRVPREVSTLESYHPRVPHLQARQSAQESNRLSYELTNQSLRGGIALRFPANSLF